MVRQWGTSSAMWNEPKLSRLAQKILKTLKIHGATLDIILLNNVKIAALKARFIKQRTEPNVLSFPEPAHFPHPETKKRYLGEVYLNRDILKKSPGRAKGLLLHGVLHLLGYDHKKKSDIVKMEGLEKKILAKL
ncbi:MAG TPA: rRNA maturation RNase YbeY [Candidatus Paceibacterota bacterium]